MQLVWGMLNTL
jgi:ABC-type phosphate/phosphonate transport system permease subunit